MQKHANLFLCSGRIGKTKEKVKEDGKCGEAESSDEILKRELLGR